MRAVQPFMVMLVVVAVVLVRQPPRRIGIEAGERRVVHPGQLGAQFARGSQPGDQVAPAQFAQRILRHDAGGGAARVVRDRRFPFEHAPAIARKRQEQVKAALTET